jgi:imidazolonepropionase-like amidohydrolase
MKPLLLSIVTSFLFGLAGETPTVYAITKARVHPVASPVMENATVVIRDGLIESVGVNVNVPSDAWLIDGTGLNVYPGLIDGLTSAGLPAEYQVPQRGVRGGAGAPAGPAKRISGPEDRPSTTSWVKTSDVVNPADAKIKAMRDAGFTTAAVFPMRGIVAGQGALVNLAGENAGEMVLGGPLGQMYTLQTGGFAQFPGSLMGVIAYVRQLHLDARHYQEQKKRYEAKPQGNRRPAYDKALEGVLESRRTFLPAVQHREIDRMLAFSGELLGEPVLYGVHEGYAAVEALAKAKVPVLVNLNWPEAPRDPDPEAHVELETLKLRKYAPSTPAALVKAGVRFGFSTAGIERPADSWKAVRKAMEMGLSREDAVRAMTLQTAMIYGVGDRVGSIEQGKIANLVAIQGEIFDEKAKVQFVMVDGKKYEPAAEAAPAGAAKPARGGVK